MISEEHKRLGLTEPKDGEPQRRIINGIKYVGNPPGQKTPENIEYARMRGLTDEEAFVGQGAEIEEEFYF